MSRFIRQETPPPFEDCRECLPFLRRDFNYRCAYCERTELVLGGEEFFEVDHFRPVSRFRELEKHYPNLYYSCAKCNRHKAGTWPSDDLIAANFRFADPCQEDMYVEPLREMTGGQLLPLTNCGAYTRDHIRLNRQSLRDWRQFRQRTAAELQTLTRTVERLELQFLLEADLANRRQIREEIEALNKRIARDREQFAM
ncbi:MAG: HNH endonuclease [Bryobacteraceae bacterium]